MKNKARKTVHFVKTHKFAIAASVVAIGAVALQQRNLREFNAFLDEKGIDRREYYTPDEV